MSCGSELVIGLVLDWPAQRVAACAYPGSAIVWRRLMRSDAERSPSRLIQGYFGSRALTNRIAG